MDLGQRLLREVAPIRASARKSSAYQPSYLSNPVYRQQLEETEPRRLPIRSISHEQEQPVSSFVPIVEVSGQANVDRRDEWCSGTNLLLIMILIIASVVVVGIVLYQLFSISSLLASLLVKISTKA
jgi:hypothetical protein